jgi:hypothetical protein
MKPQPLEIRQLIEMFVNQELLLPEMQRRFVWNSTKLRNLVDSIYRDYPSGSILMWRTDQIPETRQSAIEGDPSKSPFSEKLLLLDGQQRITSLTTVMTGRPIRVRDGDEVVEKHVEVYFNLDHPNKLELNIDDPAAQNEDARNRFFQIKNRGIENQPNWIPITKLFRESVGSILKDLRISYDDPRYENTQPYRTHLNP